MNEAMVPGGGADYLTIRDYLAIAWRRRWYFVVPTVLILVAAVGTVMSLPPVYRSTGKILIEQQEIPSEWVPATVTSFADQRIQVISQRVLTTANLSQVIEKFDLYKEEREEEGIELVVQRMREDFNINMIDAKVRDPRSGRTGVATIAFGVSFDHRVPAVAQRVANELVSLYLEENIKSRSQAVADTTRFLEEEANKLGEQISEMEARIADFKQENMGRLPEQQDLNLQLLQRAEQSLAETRRQIRSMEDRKTYLESALAQMARSRPASVTTAEATTVSTTNLEALRTQYMSLSAIYAEDHPDVVRLRRQLEALEPVDDSTSDATSLAERINALGAELAILEERYAEGHPDIKSLRRTIAALEQEQAAAKEDSPAEDLYTSQNEDPLVIKTRADLNATESDLRNLRNQAEKLAVSVQSIEQRLAEIPRAEQEYRKLVRDRDNLMAKYNDIRAKQSSARVAEALEEDRKGERFSLIEPPQLARDPIKPDRKKLMMMGFAVAFVGGFGAVVARESIDSGVRTSRAVTAATGAPVLAVIPRIENTADRRRVYRNRFLAIAAFLACIAGATLVVHIYYMPLDMLWYAVLRKLESL